MKIDFDGLHAFVTVADAGAFNKAAHELHITQTALTRRIQKLESLLGMRLIDRTTRQMELTPMGREFLPQARTLVQNLRDTLTQWRGTTMHARGHFTLACVPTMTSQVLPMLFRHYADRYPDNRVRLMDASAHEIRAAIVNRQAEVGISIEPTKHPELDEIVLFQDPLMFFCRQQHPLADRPSVKWTDMNLQDLIVVSNFMATRSMMNVQLAQRGIELQGNFEVQHHATALNLVSAGVGCAILPATACAEGDRPGVRRIPITHPQVRRKVVLTRRKGLTLPPAAQAFYEMVRDFDWK
ncbi:MAG: hypothetical protein RL657_1873 [Pseudomonadota bacterium]|jgi:DNA-binding transcriptional LysR family regulator